MSMRNAKGLERMAGGFAAALFTHPAFMALKSEQVGCLFAWARLALDAGRPAMPREVLRDHGVHFARMDAIGFAQMLAEFVALQLATVHSDGTVELVHLAAAMKSKSAESDRRKAGWEKRRHACTPMPRQADAKPAKMLEASATQESRPTQDQASLLDEEPVQPIPAPTRKSKPIKDADLLRISAGDEDESHVIVRLEVKGGQIVEFTDGFARSMEPTYPGVDVHREMLRAAEWCRGKPERRKTIKGARAFVTGWLSRSFQRREVTLAVVASGNARNGFGQGGYTGPAPQVIESDIALDFADII